MSEIGDRGVNMTTNDMLVKAIQSIGYAIAANAAPGHDAMGGTVGCATEAIMGVTAALVRMGEAISEVAEAMNNVAEAVNNLPGE